MSYYERVEKVIKSMNLGEPLFEVTIRNNNINMQGIDWDSGLRGDKFIDEMINKFAVRYFNVASRSYTVDIDDATVNIGNHVLYSIMDVLCRCSPNSEPRRTKLYKSFNKTVSMNRNSKEFRAAIFDIYEYYYNNTQTESINHENNDVHRKNIFQLLCLMEKRYGKTTNN